MEMYKWKNVTEFFSEDQRYYKNMYLEIDEVYDDNIEVSLFSPNSQDELYEIYISYGILYGIIYVEAEKVESKREEVKNELAQEYQSHKKPTNEFIDEFCKKYKVCLPDDVVVDTSGFFDF
mgnify:CR=1 FL=1